MRKILALLSLTLIASTSARFAGAAPSQATQAKQPQYKSPAEGEAYNALYNEKDPLKKASLAEAFLQKFPDTDFKAPTQFMLLTAYQQLNDIPKATDAAQKLLEISPDNLQALAFLSYVLPYTFKADDSEASTKLSKWESGAKAGLEALRKLQKPANVSDDQFAQFVKGQRAIFNGTVGFVALQRKDYAAAITSFKAAAEDNPADPTTFYREGVAYLYSSPPDYDHAVWNIARAVSLAKASKNPAGSEIEGFLKRAYLNYHGNEQGLSDIVAQAAGSADPPAGFKVAPMDVPKPTGNAAIDAFNQMAFPLKLGGEKAQKQWDALKGQPIELGGFIDSVEKGADGGTYLVRIDVLEQSKAANGVYDIELKDTSQPNVKNLSKGDPVTFKGTLTAYTATPNLVLSIDGEITTPLPEKAPVKEKPKPKGKPAPTRRPTRRTQS